LLFEFNLYRCTEAEEESSSAEEKKRKEKVKKVSGAFGTVGLLRKLNAVDPRPIA
jgi:hypothetical protein